MRIAVVYNRDSKRVINLFGLPNRERYGLAAIKRISDALKKGGHQVTALEGDKDLIDRLEDFMPRVLKGERPGMVFNVSYGIQGQARYTHVPSILEMVGIPYVGSGPLAHSLSLDKVVAKMIFHQRGLPTPAFGVLERPGDEPPANLAYPLIVKPRNEAVSFGLRVVQNEDELRAGAEAIFVKFQQPVLVEQYIAGREVNVGILGNNPKPGVLPPVELDFGDGPAVYSYEDKVKKSGRIVKPICPAPLDAEMTERVQDLARKAFSALGCYDCARIDFRLDNEGQLWILEVNSLPSLGLTGSYVFAAQNAGIDFPSLVNRLVEVASARYFGTPQPVSARPESGPPSEKAFAWLTGRRDRAERRLHEWATLSSRTEDSLGLRAAYKRLDADFEELGMVQREDLSDGHHAWTWETKKGLDNGTLLLGHFDVPLSPGAAAPGFRRDPEWVFGEGIGSSRAPIVMLEFALRALRAQRRLRDLKLGVLYYNDEGKDCAFSSPIIVEAAARAKRVLVLRPGTVDDVFVTQRRGQRKLRLVVECKPGRAGQSSRKPEALIWLAGRLHKLAALGSAKDYVSVSAMALETQSYPLLLPHRVTATLVITYLDSKRADRAEAGLRELLGRDMAWNLETLSERPPMRERKANLPLIDAYQAIARKWEIPLSPGSSLWPSVAGLVPNNTPVICGIGPVTTGLATPQEAVQRISLIQRTLLLTQFLEGQVES